VRAGALALARRVVPEFEKCFKLCDAQSEEARLAVVDAVGEADCVRSVLLAECAHHKLDSLADGQGRRRLHWAIGVAGVWGGIGCGR